MSTIDTNEIGGFIGSCRNLQWLVSHDHHVQARIMELQRLGPDIPAGMVLPKGVRRNTARVEPAKPAPPAVVHAETPFDTAKRAVASLTFLEKKLLLEQMAPPPPAAVAPPPPKVPEPDDPENWCPPEQEFTPTVVTKLSEADTKVVLDAIEEAKKLVGDHVPEGRRLAEAIRIAQEIGTVTLNEARLQHGLRELPGNAEGEGTVV